jgi:pimeloyl-ACP methyl ester carboxylesterase
VPALRPIAASAHTSAATAAGTTGAGHGRRRSAAAAALAVAALLAADAAAGCVSLRPFAEVRREQPPGSYVTVDGYPVFVEQRGPAGAADTVVLLHGFGESSYSWRQLVPELARTYRVVAPDFFGFGWSERPRDPWYYTREGQERLILGVLDALGIQRAQFVGHSYGGGLTLFLAARHPERLLSMALVDSSAPTYANDRRTRLASWHPLDTLAVRLLLRPKHVHQSLAESVADPALVTPGLVAAYLDRLRVEGEADAFYGLTARFRHPPPAPAGVPRPAAPLPTEVTLESLALPALVVWGEDDHIVPIAGGRNAAHRLPQGEFVSIPAAGHIPMEDQPAALLRALLPFLEAHRAAPVAGAGRSGLGGG